MVADLLLVLPDSITLCTDCERLGRKDGAAFAGRTAGICLRCLLVYGELLLDLSHNACV
jgi:hypothetical protein